MKELAYICCPCRNGSDSLPLHTRIWLNQDNAKEYARYAAAKGFNPICPTLYMPQTFSAEDADEDAMAMDLCLETLEACDCVIVFGDELTEGMRLEIGHAAAKGIPVSFVSQAAVDGYFSAKNTAPDAGTPEAARECVHCDDTPDGLGVSREEISE